MAEKIARLIGGSAFDRFVDYIENIPTRYRSYGAPPPSVAELSSDFHCDDVSAPLKRQNSLNVQICHYVKGVGILAQHSEA